MWPKRLLEKSMNNLAIKYKLKTNTEENKYEME